MRRIKLDEASRYSRTPRSPSRFVLRRGSSRTGPHPPAVGCNWGVDCDRKWSRATAWVAQNAFYKIETRTDWLIQTFGPEGEKSGNRDEGGKARGAGRFDGHSCWKSAAPIFWAAFPTSTG